MNCQDIDEIAAAYVLGALPVDKQAEVATHLATCPPHAQRIAELRAAATLLSQTATEKEPPDSLKANLMAAIRAEAAATTGAKERWQLRWPWRWPWLASPPVVMLLLLLVIGLLAWSIVLEFSEQGSEAFTRTLSGGDGASGRMLYIDGLDVTILSVQDLSSPPPGQVYQVWEAGEQGPKSLGLLSTSETGHGLTLLSGELSRHQTVIVTIEPAGGSPQPTAPPVLQTDR